MQKLSLSLLFAALLTIAATPVWAAKDWQGQAKDAWLDGKLETAITLNRQLNPFHIDTDVSAGMVTLKGFVETSEEKALAGKIARQIKGVQAVHNELRLKPQSSTQEQAENAKQQAITMWQDLSITSAIKAQYIASEQLSAIDIDVDTSDGIVTLAGHVPSATAKKLAVEMAADHRHVVKVIDKLEIINKS